VVQQRQMIQAILIAKIQSEILRHSLNPSCDDNKDLESERSDREHLMNAKRRRGNLLTRMRAIRLACFGFFKLDCVYREGIESRNLPHYDDWWREVAQ
jgi:hypothetical protein